MLTPRAFRGENLDNWNGCKIGKTISVGVLYWEEGGNLYTKNEYADFAFHFEVNIFYLVSPPQASPRLRRSRRDRDGHRGEMPLRAPRGIDQ